MNTPTLSELLYIKHPLMLAPMFLVTNELMVGSAIEAGATGALAAHNYKTVDRLRTAIKSVKRKYGDPFGVNLTLDFASENFNNKLNVCIEERVDFVVTSLGDPGKVVELCKPKGVKVFSDIVNMRHAQKAVQRGVDAIIAVNKNAGGHVGLLSVRELLPQLVEKFDIPIISAGGVADNQTYKEMLSLGAAGVSVGSAFIATKESPVSNDYKNAIIQSKGTDIILTKRISGIPMTVIHTKYIDTIGQNSSWLESKINKHKRIKRALRTLLVNRGFARFQHYIVGPDYKKVYCAGPAIEHVNEISTVHNVVNRIVGNN